MLLVDFARQYPKQRRARRALLLDAMAELEQQGTDCRQCSGVCCTFVANSMQTTPLETLDILISLWQAKRIDQALVDNLQHCVRRYRLDQPPPGDGRRSFLRRTYTCPFFSGATLGCGLDPDIKPYGCLGFNPYVAGQAEGGQCSSNQTLLEERERDWAAQEEQWNQTISRDFQLDWQKCPMPLALLRMMKYFEDTRPFLEPIQSP